MRPQPGLVTLCLLTLAPAWAGMGSPPAATCPRLATPPKIDGTIGAQEWADAAALSPFVLLGGEGMPSLTTEVFIGYDDRALYLGARLFDPSPGEIRSATRERDGPVYLDDCFEVFLDREGKGRHYLRLAVNTAGAMYDARGDDAKQNLSWVARVSKGRSGWNAEIAFNFGEPDEAASPAAGAVWGLTVARNAPRIGERSAWTVHQTSFADPANFGKITFAGPPLRCELIPVDVQKLWFGSNFADVTVTNLSDAAQTVKLNVRVTGANRLAHSFSVERLQMEPKQERYAKVRFTVQRGGRGHVMVSAQIIKGDKALGAFRSAPMPFELPVFGDLLDEALTQIAACFKTYALLPAADRPPDAQQRLDELSARWRYLDGEYQRRADLSADMVEALAARARALTQDAATLSAELAASAGP
jgi:hypothetical protein